MLLLTSCSNDSEEAASQYVTFEGRPGIPSYIEEVRGSGTSRSWTPPTGYFSYDDINGEFEGRQSLENTSIETFFTQNGTAPQQGTFFYDERASTWKLSMNIKQSGNYFLYGFLPKNEAASASITPNGSYSNGAVLTINGLSTVTASDICAIVGAKDGLSADDDNGVTTGQFAIHAKTPGGTNHNYVFLLFDHLYAAMGLRFTIDANYAALRTIKLRKLELKAIANNDGVPIKAKQNAQVTLLSNDQGASPIVGDIIFTPDNSSADAEMEPLFEGEVQLNTAVPVNFMGSFIPGSTPYFKMRTTYDVYDKAGNLIREHTSAENTVSLRDIFEMSHIERGHMYYITFKVQPTYLYVLSDADLDNPSMIIEN